MKKYINVEEFGNLINENKIEEGFLISEKDYNFLQSMKAYLRKSAGLEPLITIVLDEKSNKVKEYNKFYLKGANFNLTTYTKKNSLEDFMLQEIQSLIGDAIIENIEIEDNSRYVEKDTFDTKDAFQNKKINLIIPLTVRSEI